MPRHNFNSKDGGGDCYCLGPECLVVQAVTLGLWTSCDETVMNTVRSNLKIMSRRYGEDKLVLNLPGKKPLKRFFLYRTG